MEFEILEYAMDGIIHNKSPNSNSTMFMIFKKNNNKFIN